MNLTKLSNTLRYIAASPRSLYINLRLLPFKQAIKLPIIVSNKTRISSLSGSVTLKKVRTGIVRIGFGSIVSVDYSYQRSILHIGGKLTFNGKAKIGKASKIIVYKDAYLELGHNFNISGDAKILCSQHIKIGDDSLLGWESVVMDSDYHKIYDENKNSTNRNADVILGNNVWIGGRAMILKGSHIADGSVVAANATVTKKFTLNNTLLAGSPARIIKESINWAQ